MQNPEVIGTASILCRGNFTEKSDQLEEPVPVIVDTYTTGQRKVSCPYLRGYGNSAF